MANRVKGKTAKDSGSSRIGMIYARVSSKEQEREGYSIEAQLKLLREYALRLGITVSEEYIDIETAKRSGRPRFNEMVLKINKMIHQGKQRTDVVPVILVEKTDRLYRNFKDWVTLDVDELGLELHLVKEGTILSSNSKSHEKFIHGIKVLMAKNYIDNLSEEAKKGMIEKAEQGIFPTKAPLGYLNVARDGKRVIEPDPDRAPMVRKLFEWYATGNYSLLEITRMARAEGFVYRRKGDHIPKSAIHGILNNLAYTGVFMWGGKRYHGLHEPLISMELWEQVQNILNGKGNGCSHYQKHDWAFQGLLRCGNCGCFLTAEVKRGKYIYYHCTGSKGKCPEKYIREEKLIELFREALEAILLDPEVLEWLIYALKESHQDEKAYHNKAIAQLQAEYTKLQQRIDAMYDDKLDGRIDQAMYDRKYEEWRQQQSEIQRNITRHHNANEAYIEDGVQLLELTQQAVEIYDHAPLNEKKMVLNVVLSNTTYSVGHIYPVYRKPFSMIVEARKQHQNKEAASVSSDLSEKWLPD